MAILTDQNTPGRGIPQICVFRKALSQIGWLTAALWLLLAGSGKLPQPPWCEPEEQASECSPELEVQPPHQLRLSELGIERWHRGGHRGQGIKIAILDSGFRGVESFLGKTLPKCVKARSFRNDQNLQARNSQHGIYCAEVLHAFAPEAEILLANWEPDSPQAFLSAVRWAKAEGARIVSCSVVMPSWSDGEGGGEVHRQLHEMLGGGQAAEDVLCFASAGNIAERHWGGKVAANAEGWHRWQGEVIENALTPWGGDRVAVEFYGPLQSSYEIFVFHRNGTLVGKSASHQDATKRCSRAAVRFKPAPDAAYRVFVRCLKKWPETRNDAFHLVVLGGSLRFATNHGSISFPGDGASVMAVGAVDGTRNACRTVPADRIRVCPSRTSWRRCRFQARAVARSFAGTSAAAPQAAGLAALVWSRHPDRTPSQIVQAMRSAAIDLGRPGHDHDTGYGLIRLPSP